MKRFRCLRCGAEVEALAREVWHRCEGKMRELVEADDE